MQLIIDIDDKVYEHILDITNNGKEIPLGINAHMIKAIVNGKSSRKGNWIRETEGYYCSKCCHMVDEKSDFCPSCSADMRGDTE